MERPQQRAIGVNDFIRWSAEKTLDLSPKFQRRRTWPPKARSFLIDTILRGLPIPKLYMRQHLDMRGNKTIHEVVDGQQRLAAVLDFRAGNVRLPADDSEHAGKTYSELPQELQKDFLTYEFYVDLLVAATDADVLDVFARINSHSVTLNAQEKRNAKFFGSFKTTVYQLGFEHLEFWRKHKVLTDAAVARMKEAELTSELVVAMISGLQDKKKSLDSFYTKWDDRFPYKKKSIARFQETVDTLDQHLGDCLSRSIFRRPALFYSLFLATYVMRYGNLTIDAASRRGFAEADGARLRDAIDRLGDVVRQPEPPRHYAQFVTACQRQTDNVAPRRIRLETLLREVGRP